MTTETHTHRWILEPVEGSMSAGACACGATRTFTGGFRGGAFFPLDMAGTSSKAARPDKRLADDWERDPE